MRYLVISALLSLLVSAGTAVPAAAGAGDRAREAISSNPQRLVERAAVERRDGDAARPRRQHHAKHHYAKKRHARSATRHRHRTVRRSSASRQAALHRARRQQALSHKPGDGNGVGSSGQLGIASYYWEPQRLASGGWFNPNAMTAAHRNLPFGTRVRVTHRGSGRSVDVTINDRGPYIAGRIIDLSRAAAQVIGMTGQGIAKVTVQVLGR